jgi:hypothetical protein
MEEKGRRILFTAALDLCMVNIMKYKHHTAEGLLFLSTKRLFLVLLELVYAKFTCTTTDVGGHGKSNHRGLLTR